MEELGLVKSSIEKLKEIIKPNHKILEFGTGNLTLFLSQLCKKIKSIGNLKENQKKILINITKNNINNVNTVYFHRNQFKLLLRFIELLPNNYYDVLILNNSKYKYLNKFGGWRHILLEKCLPKLKNKSIILMNKYCTRFNYGDNLWKLQPNEVITKYLNNEWKYYTFNASEEEGGGILWKWS